MKTKKLLLLLPLLLSMASCNGTPSVSLPITLPGSSTQDPTTPTPPTPTTPTPPTPTTPVDDYKTIANVNKLADGTAAKFKGVVSGFKGFGVFVEDATGATFIYSKTETSVAIGDEIEVSGTVGSFGQAKQINNATISKLGTKTLLSPIEFNADAQFSEANLNRRFNIQATVGVFKSGTKDSFLPITLSTGTEIQIIVPNALDAAKKKEINDYLGNSFLPSDTIILKGIHLSSYNGVYQLVISDISMAEAKALTAAEVVAKIIANELYIMTRLEGTIVYNNLTLMTTSLQYPEATITWTSSTLDAISNTGVISQNEIGGLEKSASLSFVVKYKAVSSEIQTINFKVGAKLDQKDINSKFLNSYSTTTSIGSMPSRGNPNILVVPVQFTDKLAGQPTTTVESAEVAKTNIEKVFFGKTEETGWESLSSYYTKSSYGALNIKGTVTDFFTAPKSFADYSKDIKNSLNGPEAEQAATDSIVRAATLDYFSKEAAKGNDYATTLKYLDSNSDSYIDGVWLVYDIPYDSKVPLLWAYTAPYIVDTALDPVDDALNSYCWASYAFIKEGGYKKPDGTVNPDAHTFIHETGHLMGLNDYYDYDSEGSPCGGVDMMDYNIGDHNAYSKYLAGWILPSQISKTGEYELKPFQENGNALIYGLNYDGTAYDEYLIIEYYTPTGLNEKDLTPYSANIGTFKEAGLKVYHVDARMGEIIAKEDAMGPYYEWNNVFVSQDAAKFDDPSKMVDILHSNSASQSYVDSGELIELLSSTGRAYTTAANSDDLYKLNSDFGTTVANHKDLKFNSGDISKLVFKVTAMDATSAKITVSQI